MRSLARLNLSKHMGTVVALAMLLSACGGAAAPASAPASSAAPSAISPGSSAAAKSVSGSASTSAKPSAAGSGVPQASGKVAEGQFVDGNPYLAKPGEAPVTVKAAWCAISAGFVQWYVARDYGIFAKYGLNVQMSGFSTGSKAALAAVQSGELDFMYCAAAATIPGLASGLDATLVAAPLVGLPYVMVAGKNIHSVQDLKGKKIGINEIGDLDDRLSRAMLKKENIPANEVQLVPAGGQTERYKAVLGGLIDAVNVTPPLEVQAEHDGLNVIYKLKDLPIPFIYSAVHTNSKMLKEHPQTVQRFVAAMAEAVWFINNHKQETEQSISKQLHITDQAALDSAYQAYAHDYVNPSVDVPLAAVQDTIEYAKTQGTDIKKPKAEQIVNDSFAQNLQTSGFLEKMWGHKIPASK